MPPYPSPGEWLNNQIGATVPLLHKRLIISYIYFLFSAIKGAVFLKNALFIVPIGAILLYFYVYKKTIHMGVVYIDLYQHKYDRAAK